MPHNHDVLDTYEMLRIFAVGTVQFTALGIAILVAVHLLLGFGGLDVGVGSLYTP